jgi:transposase
MPKALQLVLTASQREELIRTRDQHPKAYLREKAAALLKISDGQSARQVATRGLLKERDPETVSEWVSGYKQKGLAGLRVKAGRGRKPAFSPTASD